MGDTVGSFGVDRSNRASNADTSPHGRRDVFGIALCLGIIEPSSLPIQKLNLHREEASMNSEEGFEPITDHDIAVSRISFELIEERGSLHYHFTINEVVLMPVFRKV